LFAEKVKTAIIASSESKAQVYETKNIKGFRRSSVDVLGESDNGLGAIHLARLKRESLEFGADVIMEEIEKPISPHAIVAERLECIESNQRNAETVAIDASAVPEENVVEVRNAKYIQPPEIDLCDVLDYGSLAAEGGDRIEAAFENVGNTCYLNALLHGLAQLASVQEWCHQHRRVCPCARIADSDCVLCHLAQDIQYLPTLPSRPSVVPNIVRSRRLWSEETFGNFKQHCAKEAFDVLVNACNEVDTDRARASHVEVHVIQNNEWSLPMWKVFGGVEKHRTTCKVCRRSSVRYEKCLSVAVEVLREHSTIEALLNSYWKEEALSDENDHCEFAGCGVYRQRIKSIRMHRGPQVLVLHLKRWYQVVPGKKEFRKRESRVNFKVSLDLGGTGTLYDLKAVIEHKGNANGGHYISYILASDKRWFLCDDDRKPCEVSHDRAMNSQAYMLFYEKRA